MRMSRYLYNEHQIICGTGPHAVHHFGIKKITLEKHDNREASPVLAITYFLIELPGISNRQS